MKAIIGILIALTSVAASANPYSPPPLGYAYIMGGHETPTMKREKLERAEALKQEASTLLAQDGGTLTAAHETYIRRKACDILGRSPRSCQP